MGWTAAAFCAFFRLIRMKAIMQTVMMTTMITTTMTAIFEPLPSFAFFFFPLGAFVALAALAWTSVLEEDVVFAAAVVLRVVGWILC